MIIITFQQHVDANATAAALSPNQECGVEDKYVSNKQACKDIFDAKRDQEGVVHLGDLQNFVCHARYRIYIDGVFDLTHLGHFKLIENVKRKFPQSTLVVGVHNDLNVTSYKRKPILTQQERCNTIKQSRYIEHVDDVICGCPWTNEIDEAWIKEHSIDFVAHDAVKDSAASDDDDYGLFKRKHMFLGTPRTKGISTTDIISRVLNDVDYYIQKQIDKGVAAVEMISVMKKVIETYDAIAMIANESFVEHN